MTIASKKPTVFMIVMPNDPVSMYYRGRVETSWTDRGFNIEYFNAVTPETMHEEKQLNFALKTRPSLRRAREFTDTEKAVWYSHRALWKIARRKQSPIIVIEHDTLLIQPIDPAIFKNVKAMGLCHAMLKDGSIATTAGAGYYLTRDVANELYRESGSTEINYNSDALIHSKIDQHGGNWKIHFCQQLIVDTIGTTIRHG